MSISKLLLALLAVVVVAVFGILAVAMTQPDSFSLERSTTVHAPAVRLFALVNDFHRWPQWSPWEKLDPAVQRSFSGATAGTGAVYSWQGNRQVGAGRMQITQSAPVSKVGIQLHFLKPFETHNTTEFSFEPQGDDTRVVWQMQGPMPLLSKVMSVFVTMDKLVGRDFERGLSNLKAVSEKAPG